MSSFGLLGHCTQMYVCVLIHISIIKNNKVLKNQAHNTLEYDYWSALVDSITDDILCYFIFSVPSDDDILF